MPERVVIQWARLGDVLQTRVLLRTLREREPASRVVLCVDARYAELAGRFPEIDDVWPVDLARLWTLAYRPDGHAALMRELEALAENNARAGLDEVYVLNRSVAAVLFAELLGSPVVRGYSRQGRNLVTPPVVQRVEDALKRQQPLSVHLADLWASYSPARIPAAWPVPLTEHATGLAQTAPQIGLLCDAGSADRVIPEPWLADLTERLLWEGEITVHLFGQTRSSNSPLSRVADQHARRVIDWRGRTTLSEFRRQLAAQKVVIGPDTGGLHLAAALGVPVVGLYFGGALAVHTGPYAAHSTVFQSPRWNEATLDAVVRVAATAGEPPKARTGEICECLRPRLTPSGLHYQEARLLETCIR